LDLLALGLWGSLLQGIFLNLTRPAVFNRTTNKSQKWTSEFEGEVCESIKDLALKSNVIFLCLSEDKDIEEVVLGRDGILEHLNEEL
jgi:3-hydroxyisobutyrate dehydrogenase-like beta-hydroxyacid dehydrogenase